MSCTCPETNFMDGKGHDPGCPLYTPKERIFAESDVQAIVAARLREAAFITVGSPSYYMPTEFQQAILSLIDQPAQQALDEIVRKARMEEHELSCEQCSIHLTDLKTGYSGKLAQKFCDRHEALRAPQVTETQTKLKDKP